MYRKLFFFIFFTALLLQSAKSQQSGRILIYSNKHDFLVPFIKTTLEELSNRKTGEKIFSKVTYLNNLLINTDADKLLREAVNYNFPDKVFSQSRNTKSTDSLFEIFTANDKFILINENTLLDKIEFQLTLYQILPQAKNDSNRNENNFPLRDLISPISESNFFIDISSETYLDNLKNGVKKLIPESNSPTQFSVLMTGNIYKVDKKHFNGKENDTIKINITDVFNNTISIDKIKFTIKILDSTFSTEKPYQIFPNFNFRQSILFKKSGVFKFCVFANDGLSETSSDTFSIKIIKVPDIFLVKSTFVFFQNSGVVFNKKRTTINLPIILSSDINDSIEFKISYDNPNLSSGLPSFYYKKYGVYDDLENIYLYENYSVDSTKKLSALEQEIKSKSSMRVGRGAYNFEFKKELKIADSVFYVYGLIDGVKTNIAKAKVTLFNDFPVMQISSAYTRYKLINRECSCPEGETVRANIFGMSYMVQSRLLGLYKFSVGVEAGMYMPFTMYLTSDSTSKFARLDAVDMPIHLGGFFSYQDAGNLFRYEVKIGFRTTSTETVLLSYNNRQDTSVTRFFGERDRYGSTFSPAIRIEFNISSIMNNKFQFFSSYDGSAKEFNTNRGSFNNSRINFSTIELGLNLNIKWFVSLFVNRKYLGFERGRARVKRQIDELFN